MYEKGRNEIEGRINLCKRDQTGNSYNWNTTCAREEKSCRKAVYVNIDQAIQRLLLRINTINAYLLNSVLPSTY